MQTLTVVNSMLGTLGEAPLNSLSEEHPLLGACQLYIGLSDTAIQSTGWWYNREHLTLQPSARDSGIYVPGDTLGIRDPLVHGTHQPVRAALRGRRLYSLDRGTYDFTDTLDVVLIRRVPFQELPEIAAAYIAADAVLTFQRVYDGDAARTRQLEVAHNMARANANAEETRNVKANMKDTNVHIQLLRRRVGRARSYY
jgi:hypothetical protein